MLPTADRTRPRRPAGNDVPGCPGTFGFHCRGRRDLSLSTEITIMNIEDFIPDAIELVNSWDLQEPDSSWREAVIQQAHLMAGQDLEPSADLTLNCPHLPLQF